MPEQTPLEGTGRRTVKRFAVAAALVGALGLGAILGTPSVGLAQTDDTTTTVSDETTTTTEDTTSEESGTDRSDGPRADHDCERDADDTSSDT